MKKNHRKTAYVAWFKYERRAETLCHRLGIKPLFIDSLRFTKGKYRLLLIGFDYIFKTIVTLCYLIKIRPDIVFCQSPPSFCPMVCFAYCSLLRKKLIVDGHNGAFEVPWTKVPFYKSVLYSATRVLVHNEVLHSQLSMRYTKGNFYTLPDPIPKFLYSKFVSPTDRSDKYFIVVVSYSESEPIEKMLEGISRYLSKRTKRFSFLFTGDFNKRPDLYKRYSSVEGIQFLGYVDNNQYESLLCGAFGVIALADGEMVQQCASIEALGAEIPLIVTDSLTNRNIFTKGAVLVKNESDNLTEAIEFFLQSHEILKNDIKELKKYWVEKWENSFDELCRKLDPAIHPQ